MPRREEARPVTLVPATPEDAGPLAVVAALAFYDDRKWMPEGLRKANMAQDDPDKGPPHTSYDWMQNVLASVRDGRVIGAPDTMYYKVLLGEDRLVGGLLVVARPDLGEGEWRCEGIFVDPDYQDRGIGKEILRQMFRNHPDASRWSLDTPEWATRNHAFYERMGFTKFAVSNNYGAPFDFFDFENTLPQRERLKL